MTVRGSQRCLSEYLQRLCDVSVEHGDCSGALELAVFHCSLKPQRESAALHGAVGGRVREQGICGGLLLLLLLL